MRRVWKILLVLIPLLVIVGAAAMALWHQKLATHLVPVVESQLSQALGREVRVGGISGGLVRGAVLHDVRIAESERLKQGALVRIKRVAVRYDLRALVLGSEGPASAVRGIDVTGADMKLARDRTGRWNIAPLLKPRPPTAGRFTGSINIADSSVTFTDYAVAAPIRRPLKLRFVKLAGRVLMVPQGGVAFRATAGVAAGGIKDVHVTGSSGAGGVVLDIAARRVSLAEWGQRLELRGVRVLGGTADIALTGAVVRRGEGRAFEYLARAQVHDGAVSFRARGPLTSINGQVAVAPGRVRLLDVSGNVGRGRFHASGTVSGFKQPELDLAITARGLTADAAARLADIRLPAGLTAGPFETNLVLRGSLAKPIAEGTVRLRDLRAQQVAARNLSANIAYRDGMVWLRQVRAEVAGGTATGDAWVKVAAGKIEAAFEAQAQELDLAALLDAAGIRGERPVAGTASVSIAGSYDARGLRAAGAFEALDGRFGDLPFNTAYGVAQAQGRSIRIASARVESPAGTAVVEGTIGSDGSLALDVRASEVDLAAAARAVGAQAEVEGTGYFAGTLSGTLEHPSASVVFEVVDAQFARRTFDLLSGAVTASREAVSVQGLLAYQRAARYAASGSLTGLGGARDDIGVAANVEVGYAQLRDALAEAGLEAEVAGDVEAQVKIGGTLGAPTAEGWARLYQPSWRGYRADRAEAQFAFSDGVVHIADARAQAGESGFTASGEVSTQGELSLAFSADLRLADLQAREDLGLPLDLTGQVTASGRVGGTVKQPLIEADVSSDRITADGETFTDLVVQARPQRQAQGVQLQASLTQGETRYSATGWLDLDARTMQLDGVVARGSLSALRSTVAALASHFAADSPMGRVGQIIAKAPSPVRGDLELQASLSGEWAKPAAEASIQITQASVGTTPAPDVQATVSVSDRVVEVRHFEARQGAAYATVTGTVDLGGRLSLDVDAFNVNAQLLEPWVGVKQRISGSADVSATIGGTVEQPQVVGSVEVADLSAGGVRVDSLRIARFEVREDSLVLDDVVAALGPHVVRASGTIPVSWRPLGVAVARPLAFTLDLSGQDLALLTHLTPDIVAASGTLDGRVELAGTWQSPELFGAVTVSDGVLQPRASQARISGLRGAIRFDGRRVLVDNVAGSVSDGTFRARGEIGLVSLRPSQLMSNRFDLSFTGADVAVDLGSLFKGRLNLDLALTSPVPAAASAAAPAEAPPVLRGQVALTSGDIGVPQRGTVRPLAQFLSFNPRLDIGIGFESGLWMRTPTISMQVSGAGHVAGRLAAPVMTAMVESRRGWVDLPAAHFRVTYGSLEASVSPPTRPAGALQRVAEVRAVIRLEAEANVRGYRVFLSMSGPLTSPGVEPQVELTSTPALDEQRLWALVTGLPFGAVTSEFGSSAGAVVTRGLGGVALYPLERALARGLGLQEFGFEYAQYEPLRIRVGGYVVPRVYGTYLRSVTGAVPEWDLRLAYEVLPSLSVGARVDERNNVLWEAQTTWRF